VRLPPPTPEAQEEALQATLDGRGGGEQRLVDVPERDGGARAGEGLFPR
jgi:hypothetical protein